MAELYFSPLANNDLSSIKDYIETELDNPKATQKYDWENCKEFKKAL